MRKIVLHPDPVLRQKTKEIEFVDKVFFEEVSDLLKILETSMGVGLAAPQIGISKRMMAMKDTETKKVSLYVNPKIEKYYGEAVFPVIVDADNNEEDFLEGCLSFPKYWGTVKRSLKVKVSYKELRGEKLIKKEREMSGYEAIVFQHEYDHLDGILFVDRVKEDGGKFYKGEGKAMKKADLEAVIEGKL